MGFTRLGRRQVVADFLGGRLTSDAGALLLREVDRRLGLLDAINGRIPDPRDPRYTVHDQRALLAQRIFSIALGYEDLNDQETLRVDPALQTTARCQPEEDQPLASPSTLCRLENRISRAITKLLVEAIRVRWPQVKITIRPGGSPSPNDPPEALESGSTRGDLCPPHRLSLGQQLPRPNSLCTPRSSTYSPRWMTNSTAARSPRLWGTRGNCATMHHQRT